MLEWNEDVSIMKRDVSAPALLALCVLGECVELIGGGRQVRRGQHVRLASIGAQEDVFGLYAAKLSCDLRGLPLQSRHAFPELLGAHYLPKKRKNKSVQQHIKDSLMSPTKQSKQFRITLATNHCHNKFP